MEIYKITNNINNKIYIGATKLDAETRFKSHIAACESGIKMPLYTAMRKYGWINFKVETIDNSPKTYQELNDLETKYIKQYNALDNNIGYNCIYNNYTGITPFKNHYICETDVFEIRGLYAKCEHGPTYWWKTLYKDRMSYSGFEKIWQGSSWANIMPEVYTTERLNYYKNVAAHPHSGDNNATSKFTDALVLEMRKYYVNHTIGEVIEKYQSKVSCSFKSLENVINRSACWKHIPRYNKRLKKWFLNDKEINIDDYKPVSTISGSGE